MKNKLKDIRNFVMEEFGPFVWLVGASLLTIPLSIGIGKMEKNRIERSYHQIGTFQAGTNLFSLQEGKGSIFGEKSYSIYDREKKIWEGDNLGWSSFEYGESRISFKDPKGPYEVTPLGQTKTNLLRNSKLYRKSTLDNKDF